MTKLKAPLIGAGTVLPTLSAVAILTTAFAAFVAQPARAAEKTVVLVHGAFADGSSWSLPHLLRGTVRLQREAENEGRDQAGPASGSIVLLDEFDTAAIGYIAPSLTRPRP